MSAEPVTPRNIPSAHEKYRQPEGGAGMHSHGIYMSNVVTARRSRLSAGLWILTLSAAAAFILLSIRYFMPHGATPQGRGALLVVFSSGLLVGAGPLMGMVALPHRLFLLLNFLVILDIICTGFLAYFIPAHVVFALMIVAAFGWFAHPGPGPRK